METLTAEERAEFDAAVLAIPAEHAPLFNAFALALRAMHRHDWSQLDNVVRGYQQMLDTRYEQEADERKALKSAIERHITDNDRRFDALERQVKRLGLWRKQHDAKAEEFDEGHP